MSFHDAGLFDVLKGGSAPFTGFGPLIPQDLVAPRFEAVVSQARDRMRDVFELKVGEGFRTVEGLEGVIESMWLQGWDPEKADFDLFARDFGTVLAETILADLGGELSFRSEVDLSHASVWWAPRRVEVFPYHKIAKRLLRQDGEDLRYFWRSLSKVIWGNEAQ